MAVWFVCFYVFGNRILLLRLLSELDIYIIQNVCHTLFGTLKIDISLSSTVALRKSGIVRTRSLRNINIQTKHTLLTN